MTDYSSLQQRAAAWHLERLPNALAEDVILKAMSELGEVADAMIAQVNRNHTGRGTNTYGTVPVEAADLALLILTLIGRYYPEHSLLALVDAKLAELEDRAGTHRSSLGAMGEH